MKNNNAKNKKLAIIKKLKTLKNIGPACADKLAQAGIETKEELTRLGSKEALMQMFLTSADPSILHPCFCYALEGAITDTAWNQIPETAKEDFKKYVKSLKASF